MSKKLIIVVSFVILLGFLVGGSYFYYQNLLLADNSVNKSELFVIKSGQTVDQIGQNLENRKLIKSKIAFKIYIKLNKLASQLKAGTYYLKSDMSTPQIVEDLLTGKTKQKMLTFYPGAAVKFRTSDRDTTPSHQQVLTAANYQSDQLDQAFKANFDHQLVKRLKTKQLEGLILGDTYAFNQDAKLSQVLKRLFDHTLKTIDDNKLEQQFAKHDLSLYQGLILASIVEREAKTDIDRQKVAQVFLTRYQKGMKLGSDVTYQYANRLAGTANDMTIDSPYNTRKYTGLPPTPICSPSISSLKSVANPASTNYIYFLAGDDGKTYFATDYATHQANIIKHCQKGCSVQ